jgi:uroporphyrinogen-III synthase
MFAIVTRDADGAAAYEAALAHLGLVVIAMPVTRIEPPEDPTALARAIARGDHAAIVVASARAAEALAAAAGRTPLPEVWAVGPATVRRLAESQIAAVWPEGVRDGAGLAQALVARRDITGQRVLVPRAEDGRDEILETLEAAGAIVDAVTAYRTVPCAPDDPHLARGKELLATGAAAVCAVFAPSQVAALDALVGIRAITAIFAAIGATTAAALVDAGAARTNVVVADTPTPEGIAKAVAAVYPARR